MFRQVEAIIVAPAIVSDYNKIGAIRPTNNPVNGLGFVAVNDVDKYGLITVNPRQNVREKIKPNVIQDMGNGVYGFETESEFSGTESLRIAGRVFSFAANINMLVSGEYYCDRGTVFFKV